RAAGLDPLRVTHANLFDSIRERVRMKKPVERSAPDRHEDQGLPLRLLPLHLRWIGSLMNLGLRAEAFYLKHDGTSLKAGHSIWMLARKP
ncbi:hypothetical protein HY256_07020, partial [Candidatus Sumerlaeota bacterium]|nr:hypothetical protein [Candidatus Sumerlaeota bacterium]